MTPFCDTEINTTGKQGERPGGHRLIAALRMRRLCLTLAPIPLSPTSLLTTQTPRCEAELAWNVWADVIATTIHVRLRLTKPPEDNQLRACTCSFCRSHNPRMLSDPVGLFEVRADDWLLVERYRVRNPHLRFSSAVAAASSYRPPSREMTEGIRAVVNVNYFVHQTLPVGSHDA